MKRLLAISWAMPPLVAPRSLNVSRSLEGLRKLDWETEVVAGDLPAAERAGFQFDADLAQRYARSYRLNPMTYGPPRLGKLETILRRLRATAGREVSWVEAAGEAAARIIERWRPHVLATFAQPFADHVIGLRLKARFPQLPWLAHFSDPWTDNPYMVVDEMDRRNERATVEKAQALVFTNRHTLRLVMAKYPEGLHDKALVVPHGFEEETQASPRPLPATPRLRLLHTGGLYGKRIPLALLDALDQLRAQGQGDYLTIHCIGPVEASFTEAALARGLGGMLSFQPPATPKACHLAALEADVLLVIDAPGPVGLFLPSKLVEYLAFNLPILALTPPEGASADLLREVGGVMAPPDDAQATTSALRDLLTRAAQGRLAELRPDPAKARRYSITQTTLLLDAALQRASDSEGRPTDR